MISGRCRRFLWAKSVSHSFPHGVEKQGFQPVPFILAVSSALFSHVLPQIPRAGFARVEVARGVYHDAFGRAGRLLHGAKGRALPSLTLPMRMPGLTPGLFFASD